MKSKNKRRVRTKGKRVIRTCRVCTRVLYTAYGLRMHQVYEHGASFRTLKRRQR